MKNLILLIAFSLLLQNSKAERLFVPQNPVSTKPEKAKKVCKKTTLKDVEWKLVSIEIESKLIPVDKSSKAKILLDGGSARVNGNGGCNSFHGSFKSDKTTVSFSRIASTRMYCEKESTLENAFVAALGAVKKYEIKKNKLYLKSDTTVLLIFQ